MKRIHWLIILPVLMLVLCSCNQTKSKTFALAFKKEYEALNGKENKSGKIHRTITVDENNPYEKISAKELIEKINNEEEFYVYFGDPLCPWCRSVIEKSIEVANSKNISKIYYVKIWDDEGNEILRSKYTLNKKGMPELVIPGTDEYYTITRAFANVLKDYILTTEDGKEVNIGEKRIYAPNYIYINNGKAIKLISGNSELQKDSREKLSTEILNDEQKIFEDFFTK